MCRADRKAIHRPKGWYMRFFTWPKDTGEERKGALTYHDSQLRVAAFLDRERSLLDGALREHWDAVTASPQSAGEICRAADRFRQACDEAVRRHEAIQPVPATASKFHRAEGSYFVVIGAWAKANLAVMETLAKGRPPFYVRFDKLQGGAESARQRANEAYRLFRRRLGLAAEEIDPLETAVRTRDFDGSEPDTWQPEPYVHDFREAGNRIIEPQESGFKATADAMTHNPAIHTNPRENIDVTCPREVPRIDPADAAGWYNEGCALATLGRHEDAADCYDKALRINPREAAAWFNKGVSLSALGRHEEAIACYDKAIELDPRDESAWYNRGVNFAALNRREEAVASFHKAIEFDPRDETAWCAKGVNLAALGRREEAIACWDRALAIDTHCVAAWCAKGVSLASSGRHKEAVACFEEALKIEPQLAPVWSNMGSGLAALNRHDEAVACCDKALTINPQDEAAWYNRGVSLAAMDRHEEAIVCFDNALKIDPRLAAAWSDKGRTLGSLGRHEEAVACYDRAVRIDPRNAVAWYNKALAQEDCGHGADAAESYRQFLQVAPPQYAELIATARRRIEELGGARVVCQA